MKWASRYYISTPLIIFLFLVSSFLFSALPQKVFADAVTGVGDAQGIASFTERWLRYRAIVGCYSANDVESQSFDKIEAGTWLDRGSGRDSRVALGYLNNDAKVSCADGAFITNSIKKIGFSSNIDSFCSMSVAKRDGKKNYANCTTGSGRFDMDGSKGDQVAAFKAAKGSKVADSKDIPYEASGAIKYWVGLKSLQKFCGGKDTGIYDSSQAGNVGEAKKKVVVNAVSLATGEIERRVYSITKNQDDTINDIWSDTGGGNGGVVSDAIINSTDLSCSKLAQLTWQHDDAFAEFIKLYNANNPDDAGVDGIYAGQDGDGSGAEGTTTCAVEKIGWIICPVSESIADGVDGIFKLVADFLVVESFTNGQTGMKNAWNYTLSFANVCFILAFLFIVYSQITGAGISNYGLKKLLPRLIIAAILVNTSYWICALAVDLSNVAGYSINNLFEIVRNNTGATAGTPGTQVTWVDFIGTVLTGSAIGTAGAYAALAANGSALALLWAAVPLLLAALFAIFVALVILAARQALLIVLIVVAPLAFVAYLLPNTQKWFDKWRELFTTLLLMFPIIAAIFGGSQLASAIILSSANSLLTVLLALTIQFIPLALTPMVIKFSGGLLNRFAGIVNDRSKGVLDRTKNAAKERQELATKRGVAQGNNFLNRMGRRRDLGARRRKSQGDQYEAESESRFQRSNRGSTQVQNTAYAQEDARQRTSINTNTGQLSHVASNRALYGSVYSSEDKLKTEQQRSKNDYSASQTGRTNAQDSKVAEKTGQNIGQQQENAYLASSAGRRQSASGKKLGDENKTLEARHEEEYLTSSTGERTRTRLIDAQGDQAIAEQLVKNVQAGSISGLAQAETLLVAKGAGDTIGKQVQLNYDQSGVGQTQNQSITELSDQINAQQIETSDAAKNSAIGEVTAQRKAVAEQRSQLTTKRAEAALEGNQAYVAIRTAAETAGQTAKAATDRIDSQIRADTGYIDAALESDAASQGLNVTDSRLEAQKIENNADERAAAQAAKDTTAATQADFDALIAESRTEEGAAKYGIQGNPVVQELQTAATQQRVERQRASSAENIGNIEYAARVSASEGVAGGLAEVAGGIDPYGARRAVSAAQQIEIEQFNKNVSTEKSTMSSLNDEQLYTVATDPSQSTERRAAAAGNIMKNGSMGSIHNLVEHFKETIPPENTAEAAVVKNIQMQMSSDISRTPFGFGDTDLAALRRGELGQAVEQYNEDGTVVLDSNTGEPILSADTRSYDEMIAGRVKGKMSGEAWSRMDPDDRTRILKIAQSNPDLLGQEGRKNLLLAFTEINQTNTLKAATKTDAKERANSIAIALGETPVFTDDE